MKFTRLPFLLGALAVTTLAAHAQQTATRTYTSVDAYGNVVTQTVQIPLANASSPGALIAQQSLLGNNTTSSSFSYGNNYGPIQGGYCPPDYPVYANPYPYGGTTNNYFYPTQPYNGPIGQYRGSNTPWVTSIPLNNGYNLPANPYFPPVYSNSYNGFGYGSIITKSQSSRSSVSLGNGAVSGRYNGRNSTTSTVVLPGQSSYIPSRPYPQNR